MIECEKDSILILEYEPGMFRKVMVSDIWAGYRNRVEVGIIGMTSRFNKETGEEIYRKGYFKRKISAYDPAKIEGTKIEKERRRLVKFVLEHDWGATTLERLRAVYDAAVN